MRVGDGGWGDAAAVGIAVGRMQERQAMRNTERERARSVTGVNREEAERTDIAPCARRGNAVAASPRVSSGWFCMFMSCHL